MSQWNYEELEARALADDATKDDINALGEWFEHYGRMFWNGDHYRVSDEYDVNLYPVYRETSPDDYEIIGWSFSQEDVIPYNPEEEAVTSHVGSPIEPPIVPEPPTELYCAICKKTFVTTERGCVIDGSLSEPNVYCPNCGCCDVWYNTPERLAEMSRLSIEELCDEESLYGEYD